MCDVEGCYDLVPRKGLEVGDRWARRVVRRIWVYLKGITTDSRLDLGETQPRRGEVDIDAARKDQMTSEGEGDWRLGFRRVLW